jgi:hypothetical protein
VPPPHIVKQLTVKEYASRFKPEIFVETGTFDGDMVYTVKGLFRHIYTIEIFEPLHRQIQHRFRRFPHISALLGDSAVVLPDVLRQIDRPALFWLDGHFSGIHHGQQTGKTEKDTPIMEELAAIASHSVKTHILLIDDARCFDGTHDYPDLPGLEVQVRGLFRDHEFSVSDDIIRVSPR